MTTRRTASLVAGSGLALAAGSLAILMGGPARPSYLPDPSLTPGDVIPGVGRQDTCDSGYAKRVRDVPDSVKIAVFRRYGIEPTPENRKKYEIDHLICLSIGGSNSVLNLWPEPWDGPKGAHTKDRLENWLYLAVCRGELTIGQAQSAIRGDWTVAARKYLPAPKVTMGAGQGRWQWQPIG
jgi:hypothetical protein